MLYISGVLGFWGSVIIFINGKDAYQFDYTKLMMAMAFIFIGFRGLTNLRVIKNFRVLINLIIEVVYDMIPFTIILILVMFIMAIGNNVNRLSFYYR